MYALVVSLFFQSNKIFQKFEFIKPCFITLNAFTIAIISLGMYALHISPYTGIRLTIENNRWIIGNKDRDDLFVSKDIHVGDELIKLGNVSVERTDFMRFPEFFLKSSERNWWDKQKALYETLRNNDTVKVEISRDGNAHISGITPVRKNMPLSQIIKRTVLIYVSSLLFIVIGVSSFPGFRNTDIHLRSRFTETRLQNPALLSKVLCTFFASFGALYLASVAPLANRDLTLSPIPFHTLLAGAFVGAGGLITLVHFSLIFPRHKPCISSHSKIVYVLYIYFLLTVILYFSGICAFGMFFPFLLIWTTTMICAFIHSWIHEKNRFLRQQISIGLIAPLFGGIVFVFANLLPAFLGLPTLDFSYFALIVLILPFTLCFITENYRLYMEKNKRDLENQKERERIMEELHDSLGNDLTNIKMFSEIIPTYLPGNMKKAGEYINLIKEAAKNGMEQLRDFLWSMETKYTTWDDLMDHLKEYGSTLFQTKNIYFDFQYLLNGEMPQQNSTTRFNVYRIYKEALGNILKHAQARNVRAIVSLSSKELEMKIKDDGIGFIPEHVSKNDRHHGIKNIQKRIKEMGGVFRIDSEKGKGTLVYVKIPLGDT